MSNCALRLYTDVVLRGKGLQSIFTNKYIRVDEIQQKLSN